jgi:hypothetical protein
MIMENTQQELELNKQREIKELPSVLTYAERKQYKRP